MRILKRVSIGALGLVAVVVLTAVAVANSQDGSIWLLQKMIYSKRGAKPNSFEPAAPPHDVIRPDGRRIRTEVKYGDRYPNSFLDIWYPTADLHVKRPTVIFIHGGGWFAGSKSWGDPMAAGSGAYEPMNALAAHGFNVVNLDYALAPAYRYPVPMIQLNEAIAYLKGRAGELGLDMTNLAILGGSAGAQMTAQYGALLSDPAYAAEVGIKPAIAPSSVKALGIWSAPLKTSGFGWRMNAILWPYLGAKDLETSPQARQMNILARVNPRFPPTYLTDGNQPDTFPEHAKALDRLLTANHVDHVFNYHEPSQAILHHTYTGETNSRWGRDNLDKTITFIDAHTRPAVTAGRRSRAPAMP